MTCILIYIVVTVFGNKKKTLKSHLAPFSQWLSVNFFILESCISLAADYGTLPPPSKSAATPFPTCCVSATRLCFEMTPYEINQSAVEFHSKNVIDLQ